MNQRLYFFYQSYSLIVLLKHKKIRTFSLRDYVHRVLFYVDNRVGVISIVILYFYLARNYSVQV